MNNEKYIYHVLLNERMNETIFFIMEYEMGRSTYIQTKYTSYNCLCRQNIANIHPPNQ